jgi:putative ABC transport system permease protein
MILDLLPRDLRESIAGDLAEEYESVRRRRGRAIARAWYWWNAVRLAALFRWEKVARGRPLPPIADQAPRRVSFVEGLRQDVAFGVRMLRRQPGFTTVAIVALALGIGANTGIFSIVDAVLWRPLPYPHPDEIVLVGEQRPREGRVNGPVAPADFLDWRVMSRSFLAMASVTDFALNLTGDVEPQRLRALAVSPPFFDALGVAPARGRAFNAEEEEPGRHRVAILTDGLWRSAFGRRPDIVGTTVQLNAEPYEIVGVLPPGFWWTSRPDVLVPRPFGRDQYTQRSLHMFSVVARLQRGVTLAQARADMDEIGRQLAARYPDANANHFPQVTPIRDVLVGDTRQALLVLLGAVGLVLLIACANVSTLLVARATVRRKEIAIRLTMGASRGRLIRQLLTESVLLAAIGGGVGVLLATWMVPASAQLMPARLLALPGLDRIGIDVRVLVAAIAATVATSFLFGVVPAYTASGDHLAAALGEGGRSGTAGGATRRARAALVVAELALSLMLLVGAGLLIVSFRRLVDVSPGFQVRNILTMRVTLPQAKYGDQSRVTEFFESLLTRLRAAPGVEAAAAITMLPFTGSDARASFLIEGRTAAPPAPVRARPIAVSPDYLQTMRIQLLRGRYLSDHDADGRTEVVVLNESAARRYWPDEDPIGRRISFAQPKPRWLEIVGIVGDVKSKALDVDPEPEAYLSYWQKAVVESTRAMTVVVRTTAQVDAAAPLLRTAVAELDRDQPIGPVRPMDDLVAESLAPARLNLWLLVAFAVVALVLTAEGLYGVMAYLVTQRSHEIGIRMALGASRSAVLRMMLRDAGTMTLAGIAIGIGGALMLSRSLAALLFGVSATDPIVYAGVSALLALVALAAVLVPSSRATRVDPLSALREP